MGNKDSRPGDAVELRQQAEAIARNTAAESPEQLEALSPKEVQQMLQELRVHQIELEMQNEELRRAQVALDSVRARYFDLYDLAPVGYLTVSEQGMILEANMTFANQLGSSRRHLVSTRFAQLVFHEDQSAYYLSYKKLFKTSERQVCELRMVKKDGRVFWAHLEATPASDATGAPRCRVVMVDITERKELQENVASLLAKTQADKDFLNLLLANMADEVWFADSTGRFTLENPAACKAFALEKPENIDIQTFAESLEVLRPDGTPRPIEETPPLRALAGETVTAQEEIIRLPVNGDLRYRQVNSSPMRDPQGTIIGCVSVVRDITDHKKAEAEQESLQAQLHQSQKLEAIGQLAGGVAHDINNLLTGILGNVAIIRGDLPASDPLVANLLAVETAARQAADLTKGLLTFSRRAVVAAVPLDMGEAVETTLTMLKQSLPATMEIVRDVEQPAWSVLADRSQITQVILNLAVNARDAMHGRGTLTIRTRNEVVGEDYVQNHAFARTGEFVHVSVADTGPGIPPEILEHLFEPFHTTKPAGSGTGLGLSIVYGAVKQADGWVTVDSPPSGGALFDIFLPRCLEKPIAQGVPVHVPVQVCSGTVLVVEDEPVVCAVAQSLLARSGYTVLTAGDGASALRVLQEHQGSVDLILLDMTMPGMTTQEIVPALRAFSLSVPILLTSGYTSGDIVKHMLEEGAVQGFLAKPYEMHELLDEINQLVHTTERGPG